MATKFKPLVSDATLRRVYENMLRARLLDDALAGMKRAKHIATGRQSEAIDAVVLDGLKARDMVVTANNRPSAALLRGEHVDTVVGHALSKDATSSRALLQEHKGVVSFAGSAGEMATFAAGCAKALQSADAGERSAQPAVVALLGKIVALDEIESALRAVSHGNLPLILVAHVPAGSQLEIAREKTHGVPNLPADASDAVGLMRCAQESLVRVRSGLGGVLISARALPDSRDPLLALEEHMRRKNIFHDDDVATAQRTFARQLDRTLQTA